MALSTDRDHNIRKELNGTAPNPEQSSEGIRADIIAAAWGEGDAFPTAAGQVWRGRQFWRTDLGALYIYNGIKWVQFMVPVVASGVALVGANWDGVGAIHQRFGHTVLTASPLGTGNANWEFDAFPNGLLFASVQLVETVATACKVRWKDSDPASTLGKLELNLTTAGQPVPAGSFHRLAFMVYGW